MNELSKKILFLIPVLVCGGIGIAFLIRGFWINGAVNIIAALICFLTYLMGKKRERS
jgi:hypothetical protein